LSTNGEATDVTLGNGGTIATAAYGRIRADILAARIAPGAKLRIREICERYAIGLSPMREALNRLSAEKLVVINDQRGFTVSGISSDLLMELTRSRIWLNELALRRSVEFGNTEWEEKLLLSFHRLSKVSRYSNGSSHELNPAWDAPHRAFHAALIAACPSSWIKGYCEQLFDQADRYRNLSRSIVLRNRSDIDEHQPIMERALAKETEEAVRLLTQHVARTTQILLDHWDDVHVVADG
jgi:GntR family transcriptional regulator, carbon starvation induced regulator